MHTFKEFLQKSEPIQENAVRYEALEALKQVQATIAGVSLLGVLGVMKEDNPLRKNILDMENQLHDLSANLGQFISDNIADVETEEGKAADAEPEEKEPKKDKEKKPAKKNNDKNDEPAEVKGDAPKEQDEPKNEE